MQRVDAGAIPVVLAAVQGDGPDLRRPVVQDPDQVRQGRRPGGGGVVPGQQHPQGRGQHRAFVVRDGGAAHDQDQPGQHRQAAAVGFGPEPVGVGAAELLGGLFDGADVQDVQAAQAAAELDDLAADRGDQVGVVRLQVAQHQRADALGGQAQDLPAGEGGLAQAG